MTDDYGDETEVDSFRVIDALRARVAELEAQQHETLELWKKDAAANSQYIAVGASVPWRAIYNTITCALLGLDKIGNNLAIALDVGDVDDWRLEYAPDSGRNLAGPRRPMTSPEEYIRQLEEGHRQRDKRHAEIVARLAATEAERDALRAQWNSVPLRAIYELCQWMYSNRHYGNPLYQHVWGWIVKYYKETPHD